MVHDLTLCDSESLTGPPASVLSCPVSPTFFTIALLAEALSQTKHTTKTLHLVAKPKWKEEVVTYILYDVDSVTPNKQFPVAACLYHLKKRTGNPHLTAQPH